MMGTTLSPDHHHKLHHYLTKKTLHQIDIPPRKLLTRRPTTAAADSPTAATAAFSKFLPYNNAAGDSDDSDDSDPYSSDHFRMYEFKVRKCNRSRSHDWTDCPFAHPGEKARRRDPRRYHYTGTVCTEFRKGSTCSKGDNCEFSHGVFECWLHPTRYRTEACKDGKNCKRKVCFFAHTTRQLRLLPDPSPTSPPPSRNLNNNNNCCVFCHSMSTDQSPTSTLMGVSVSHVSPPDSPPPEYTAVYGDHRLRYKDAVNELMATFEGMNVRDHHHVGCSGNRNLGWLDVNSSFDEQPQFVMSPSTPNPSPSFSRASGVSKFSSGDSGFSRGDFSGGNLMEDVRTYNNEGSSNLAGPDLGWVNDLLT